MRPISERGTPGRLTTALLVFLLLTCWSCTPQGTADGRTTPTPTPTATSTGASSAPQSGQKPDDGLWFAPSSAPTSRLYLAHYFGPAPRSLDNEEPDYYTRNYLSASGESGSHAAYGGFWRDRPLERPPLAGDFRLQDATWEIQAAQRMNIDGFLVDILSIDSSSFAIYQKLVDAAVSLHTDFKIIPMIDTTGEAAAETSPTDLAHALDYFVGKASSYYLPDGRFLVTSFFADKETPQWWSDRLQAIADEDHVKTAFHAGLLDLNRMRDYASIATFVGPWSYGADPQEIESTVPGAAAEARSLGLGWMGSALSQNVRPAQGTFDEAANSEALRSSWARIEREHADLVQAVTWNDFSEGSQLEPSTGRSWGPAAIGAYYAEEWKTGRTPTVLRDELILSHRDQPLDGVSFQSGQTSLMKQNTTGQTATAPRNDVEALTYLTAPATVTVTIGGVRHSYAAPAGEHAETFPLALGSVSGAVRRGGTEVAAVQSPFPVTDNPVSQDRQYFFVSSLHGTDGQHPMMTP